MHVGVHPLYPILVAVWWLQRMQPACAHSVSGCMAFGLHMVCHLRWCLDTSVKLEGRPMGEPRAPNGADAACLSSSLCLQQQQQHARAVTAVTAVTDTEWRMRK